MSTKTFIVAVESEPRIQFTVEWDGDRVPDMIRLADGDLLILVGKYASSGDHYSYKRPNHIMDFKGAVAPWPQYTAVKGN